MVCGPTKALDSRRESGGEALVKLILAHVAALAALVDRCSVPSLTFAVRESFPVISGRKWLCLQSHLFGKG